MKILMLASWFGVQYRVLRCAAQTACAIVVAGPDGARALAASRHCAAFEPFSFGDDPEYAASKVDALARKHGIDMILPSDAVTTRFVASMKPYLLTPSFPVPALDAFDKLATKDAFMRTCRALDIPHPQGRMIEDRAALKRAYLRGTLRLPSMLKPVDLSGGTGVVRIDAANAATEIAKIRYAPILVQDFIEGDDVSMTVFCRAGAIAKQVVFSHPGGVFHFMRQPAVEAIAARIVAEMRLDGVINFDARVDRNGRVWMIECNPRFYYNMDVAMVAGLNFARLDDVPEGSVAQVPECRLRVPQAALMDLLKMRLPTANDRKMLRHWLDDPLAFLMAMTQYHRNWRVPAFERWAVSRKARA